MDPVARIGRWVEANMATQDGAAVLDRARAMGCAEALELADFLDELPW